MPAPDSAPKGLNYLASTLAAPVSPAEAALRPLSFSDFTGQLKTVLRDQYLVDAKPVNKVSGQPFTIAEIEAAIEEALA